MCLFTIDPLYRVCYTFPRLCKEGTDMEADQTYTSWDIAGRVSDDASSDESSDFFYELLSEQRY